MTEPIKPLVIPKSPVRSAYPPAMQRLGQGQRRGGSGGARPHGQKKNGVILNFLTAYLDSGFAFQIALFVTVFWAKRRPLDSFEAQKSYIVILVTCLVFYFVLIPIGLRATLGRLLLKKQMILTFILGTAFLYFTTDPLVKDIEEIFYASPAVMAAQKLMAQSFGAQKAQAVFIYFTPNKAKVFFMTENQASPLPNLSVLPLIFDGGQWIFENNPQ